MIRSWSSARPLPKSREGEEHWLLLAAGVPESEGLAESPYLQAEDIRACLEYAAQEVVRPVLVVAEP